MEYRYFKRLKWTQTTDDNADSHGGSVHADGGPRKKSRLEGVPSKGASALGSRRRETACSSRARSMLESMW